jgi:Leucine-rich repeat (LRR) protein
MFSRRTLPVWIGILALSGMFLMGQTAECPWNTVAVSFPDDALEVAIRLAIGKPSGPICSSALEGLTYLDASDSGIADLTGLEYCTGLDQLFLDGDQISDLSPLQGLVGMRAINLSGNQISDLNPLTGLIYLYGLDLSANQITDIYPLVDNYGIGPGDFVDLTNNPLDDTSCTVYIPELQSKGVNVLHDCP